MFKYPPYNEKTKAHQKQVLSRPGGYTRSCVVEEHTTVFIVNHHGRKFSDTENEILIRFGRVFEQSYVRYLDLAKAEAQAREAQIETSLERVRAASMAMQSSNELPDVALVLFNQIEQLGIKALGVGLNIVHESSNSFDQYLAFDDLKNNIKVIKAIPGFDLQTLYISRKVYQALKKTKDTICIQLTGAHLDEWIEDVKLNVDKKRGKRLEKAAFESIIFKQLPFMVLLI